VIGWRGAGSAQPATEGGVGQKIDPFHTKLTSAGVNCTTEILAWGSDKHYSTVLYCTCSTENLGFAAEGLI